MELAVLYSGSSGNCAYIQNNDGVILIDAGVSCKKIITGLAMHQITLDQVKGIVLTHEHADHVIGLKQLVDRHKIPLYTNQKTYTAIPPKHQPQTIANVYFFEDTYHFEQLDFTCQGLPISHDVVDGRFYIMQNDTMKIVYLTDSGYVPTRYYEAISNADVYVMEANHEPELVLQSRYPWHIQQRILSDKGHLSNQDCALLLSQVVGQRTKHIILAHLSEENNMPDIAYKRIHTELMRTEFDQIKLYVAKKDNTAVMPFVI